MTPHRRYITSARQKTCKKTPYDIARNAGGRHSGLSVAPAGVFIAQHLTDNGALDLAFFQSDGFVIGYYILTVAAALMLIKETKPRLRDLKEGIKSARYAPFSFGIIIVYALFGFEYLDSIPYLNWSWLGYNIAFGPFADQGIWAIIPFVPLLVYMFIHINYLEEMYFRKSKKMVLVWALIHIGMGVKIHTALLLIPVGFLFKYIYDKKGIKHAYAMHFTTNILVVASLFLTFVA